MAITIDDVFRVDTPTGADDPREGDDRIREVKAALMERLQAAGMFIDNETDDSPNANAGRLSCGVQDTDLLKFYETDNTTIMAEFDDSTSIFKLGTGRGGGANSWIIEAETANFEALDVDGNADVGGTLGVTGLLTPTTLPAKFLYNINQATSSTELALTVSYVSLAESVTFTTAAAAGDVLVSWNGVYRWQPNASTDSVRVDIRIRRGTTQILEVIGAVALDSIDAAAIVQIPITLQFLDTGASDNTSTTYDIQAKHAVVGSPTQSKIKDSNRILLAQEFIWN